MSKLNPPLADSINLTAFDNNIKERLNQMFLQLCEFMTV